MQKKENIENIVHEWLADKSIFLVDIAISQQNRISVFIDSLNGVTINECAKLSRFIENKLEEAESEDFELQVSSPGLDQPFKVTEQYQKYTNKEVVLVLKDGGKKKGILKEFDNSTRDLILIEKIKQKNKSSKKKEIIEEEMTYNLENIKSTKVVISFS